MKVIFVTLLLCATAVYAQRLNSRFSSEEFDYDDNSADSSAKYDFSWQVSEEDSHFARNEQRLGDNTRGSYSVQLPDGRIQTVTYYVDGPSGYVARVSYSGNKRVDSVESRELFAGNGRRLSF